MIASVFFDLDGTLADTAADLNAALNQILREQHKPAIPLEKIRPYVSLGSIAMIKQAFAITEEDPELENIRKYFLKTYRHKLNQQTCFFAGIEKVLKYMAEENITWGIVTNKPSWLSLPIIKHLGLTDSIACLVSGDTTEFKKPHPQPVLHACKMTQSQPDTSVYIGDALTDIEAGRAAGMKTLIATYGYIAEHEAPNKWDADGQVSTPEEIIYWLKKENNPHYNVNSEL